MLIVKITYALSPVIYDEPKEYYNSLREQVIISNKDILNFENQNFECYQDLYELVCYFSHGTEEIDLRNNKPIVYRLYFSNNEYKNFPIIQEQIENFLKYSDNIYDKKKLKLFFSSITVPVKDDIKQFYISDDLVVSFYSLRGYKGYKDRNNLIMIYKKK